MRTIEALVQELSKYASLDHVTVRDEEERMHGDLYQVTWWRTFEYNPVHVNEYELTDQIRAQYQDFLAEIRACGFQPMSSQHLKTRKTDDPMRQMTTMEFHELVVVRMEPIELEKGADYFLVDTGEDDEANHDTVTTAETE